LPVCRIMRNAIGVRTLCMGSGKFNCVHTAAIRCILFLECRYPACLIFIKLLGRMCCSNRRNPDSYRDFMCQRHYFLLMPVCIVFVFKTNVAVIYVQNPVRRNGYLMSVTSQVFDDLCRATNPPAGGWHIHSISFDPPFPGYFLTHPGLKKPTFCSRYIFEDDLKNNP
jgi:hypothetical protein